jgi:hypothetical protein
VVFYVSAQRGEARPGPPSAATSEEGRRWKENGVGAYLLPQQAARTASAEVRCRTAARPW